MAVNASKLTLRKNAMPRKMVLVTGGTGFIGSHLTKYLAKAGYDVRVLVRKKSPNMRRLSNVDVEFAFGDIRQLGSLVEATTGIHKVFHCAAVASDWAPKRMFYEVNVGGTENILKACLAAKVERFIGISTNDVFGRIENRLIDESFPLKRWNEPYPDTKILAEELIWKYHRMMGLPVTIVYPCWVYGANDTTFLPHVIKAVIDRHIAFWRKEALVWPTFIENLLDLLRVVSEDQRAIGNGYLIHDGKNLHFEDFCNKIADSIGVKHIRMYLPYFSAYFSAIIVETFWKLFHIKTRPPITTYVVKNLGSRHQYSIEKAGKELGWKPKISFEEGFSKTIHVMGQ